ncbi:MAG: lyase family protein, partial [Candidatus Liptonbacteria bacterium]
MKSYYGSETRAALSNFPFESQPFPKEFVYAAVSVKLAAVSALEKTGEIDEIRSKAIQAACREILKGAYNDQFVLPALQGGAGTSFHANINEVIANRANEILREKKNYFKAAAKAVKSAKSAKRIPRIHPNDHVNRSQSTNDVLPSALKIASVKLAKNVISAARDTVLVLKKKSKEFKDVVKLGRTHLQDAVPTTLGAEFASYAALIERDIKRIEEVLPYLRELNLGGTAIGNGINTSTEFKTAIYKELKS